MPKTKVAVTLDARLVKEIDSMVKRRRYARRSAAIEAALRDQAKNLRETEYDSRLAQLDPDEERAWANLRYHGDVFG